RAASSRTGRTPGTRQPARATGPGTASRVRPRPRRRSSRRSPASDTPNPAGPRECSEAAWSPFPDFEDPGGGDPHLGALAVRDGHPLAPHAQALRSLGAQRGAEALHHALCVVVVAAVAVLCDHLEVRHNSPFPSRLSPGSLALDDAAMSH